MMMNQSTFNSVLPSFCLTLSRAWYKKRRLIPTPEYTWSVARQVLLRTKTDNPSPEYLFDWYIAKIRDKFPDYVYLQDRQACEEYEERVGQNIPLYIKNQAYVKPNKPPEEVLMGMRW
jgi:hypothetical protein